MQHEDERVQPSGFDTVATSPEMVSIIIPVYNGGKLLDRAVRSVLQQTYRNVEIMIVDDGSTDDSLLRARRLADHDARIKVIAIDNSCAPGRPRNYGIDRSSGEFIAFLDQDDWWFANKLERQLTTFREGEYDVVYSDAVFLDHRSPESGRLWSELAAYRERVGFMPAGQVQRQLIHHPLAPWSTHVIRSESARSAGRMVEGSTVDDYEYLLRISMAGGRFGVVREPLSVWDRRPEGLGSSQRIQHAIDHLSLFNEYLRRFPEYEELWNLRLREWRRYLLGGHLESLRDQSMPLRKRLASLWEVQRTSPSILQGAAATKYLVPPEIRHRLRTAMDKTSVHFVRH
jgi:glycosyltransferase involved in cell wall biosynthesis